MLYGEIPLTTDGGTAPHFSQRTLLDGREYTLICNWNARLARWTMTFADGTGASIVEGIVLVSSWPLLRGVTDVRRPAGELVILPTSGDPDITDPTLDSLGTGHRLYYVTEG